MLIILLSARLLNKPLTRRVLIAMIAVFNYFLSPINSLQYKVVLNPRIQIESSLVFSRLYALAQRWAAHRPVRLDLVEPWLHSLGYGEGYQRVRA
jgi:hypothetical protein